MPEFDFEVCTSRYEERQMWQAIVKKFMKPEHSEIGRIEADLSTRAIAVGGEPDGLGCIRIEDLKKKADPVGTDNNRAAPGCCLTSIFGIT